MLSLYAVLESAFFVPGSDWLERLNLSLAEDRHCGLRLLCQRDSVCIGRARKVQRAICRSRPTLPVQLFFWAMAGVVILFVVSSYLEVYYVPLLGRNLPPG